MANALNDMLRQQMLDMARRGYRDLPLGGTTEAEYRALSESMNSGVPSMTSLLAGLSGYSLAQQEQRKQQLDVMRNSRLDDANIDNTYANIDRTNAEAERTRKLMPGEVDLQKSDYNYRGAQTAHTAFQTHEGNTLLDGKTRMQNADIYQTYGQGQAARANAAQGYFAVKEGNELLDGKVRMQNADIYHTYGQGNAANANAYVNNAQGVETYTTLPAKTRDILEKTNQTVSQRAGQDQANQAAWYNNRVLAQTEAYRVNEAYRAGAGLKDGNAATTAPPVFGNPAPATGQAKGPVPLPPGVSPPIPGARDVKMDAVNQKNPSDPVAMYKNAADKGWAAVQAGAMTKAEWNTALMAVSKWQQVGTTGITPAEDAILRRFAAVTAGY